MLRESGVAVPDYIGIDGVQRQIRHSNEFLDYFGTHAHFGAHRPGDIIIFSKNGQVPTHVGIVRDEESYIHAPGKENTKVTVSAIAQQAIIGTGP